MFSALINSILVVFFNQFCEFTKILEMILLHILEEFLSILLILILNKIK